MIVRHIDISNFRGIASANLTLGGHTLLVGPNNVGKSTILEAVDLVLGPERLAKPDAISEHDFYRGQYVADGTSSVPIVIDTTLSDLSEAEQRCFRDHLEMWHRGEQRIIPYDDLNPEEVDAGLEAGVLVPAIRVRFEGRYDAVEDEFRAETFFLHPPSDAQERPWFQRKDKRLCGFLYLRTLRTGTRALSLERGTLLDIILRQKETHLTVWEQMIGCLRSLQLDLNDHEELRGVLGSIEARVNQYIPLAQQGDVARFFVSNLTRENLRRVVALFLASEPSRSLIPSLQLGHGTVNVLVFALLTILAELKENVIFAMEEPEIALPPYTQRRIVKQIHKSVNQCLFTSHSPYVAEHFLPDKIVVLQRAIDNRLQATQLRLTDKLKEKSLHREFRNRFAEGLLSRAVITVEGPSDRDVLQVVSDKLAQEDDGYTASDVAGITIIDGGGDGTICPIGEFFRGVGLGIFTFYDRRDGDGDNAGIQKLYDIACEHQFKGLEELLAAEVPFGRLVAFVEDVRSRKDFPTHLVQPSQTDETAFREYVVELLKARKGSGYAAHLVALCLISEVPTVIKDFLLSVDKCLSTTDEATESDQTNDEPPPQATPELPRAEGGEQDATN